MAARDESRIGRGTVVRGTVRGVGDLEIEGTVHGVVEVVGDLSLTETAKVRVEAGALKGARVTVRGAVAGAIEGEVAIVLEEGARVVGDLTAPSVGIRPGGMLRGYVATGDGESEAPTKNRAQLARPAAPSARSAPARPAPPPRTPATQRAPVTRARAAEVEKPEPAPAPTKRQEAPPPVMPTLKKNQRGQMKQRKAGAAR
jgi:cytoskeletal protein CcmA (bactofilin family)